MDLCKYVFGCGHFVNGALGHCVVLDVLPTHLQGQTTGTVAYSMTKNFLVILWVNRIGMGEGGGGVRRGRGVDGIQPN